MSKTIVHSNPNLTQNSQPVPLAQNEPSPFPSKMAEVREVLSRPFSSAKKWGEYLLSPAPAPTDTLKRINERAEKGLKQARETGVTVEPVAAPFQAKLEKVLNEQRATDPVAPVAATSSQDPPVTRALPLQVRAAAIDWHKEIERYSDAFCKKLSVFKALSMMREECGLSEKESLIPLVQAATEGSNPLSVWKLFTGAYQLTFFQKIKAAWFYWIYYKTSLITNTVNAYVEDFIQSVTNDLTNEETRGYFFNKFLENTNQFLIGDIQAREDFAHGRGRGGLEDYRMRAVEGYYGSFLEGLCKFFSERTIEKRSPIVPFLRKFHKIPILGWFARNLEIFVNRYIIKKKMKALLPKVFESTTKKGLTQTMTLSFSLHVTRFFVERLQEFDTDRLNRESETPDAGAPGTSLLPETVKHLQKDLYLFPYRTAEELRDAIEKRKNGKGYTDRVVDQGLEQAIIDGGNRLFNYLHETARSGELFGHILELSLTAFSPSTVPEETVRTQFTQEYSKFERIGSAIAGKLLQKGVAKKINETLSGKNPETIKKIAEESFEQRRTVAKTTFDEFRELCTQMKEKINKSTPPVDEQNKVQPPNPQYNIQTNLASFLQIMQVFTDRKEIQDQLPVLSSADRNILWSRLTPLYQRAEAMQNKVLHLQQLQDFYSSHLEITNSLRHSFDLLQSIRNEFQAQPRHFQNPLIQTLGTRAEEVSKRLGSREVVSLTFNGFVREITRLSENMVREQKTIDAIYALYPPRLPDQIIIREGFLDQMLNYERGVFSSGFKPYLCRDKIREYLAYFPDDERLELKPLIDPGPGDPPLNLKANWTRLEGILQRIYEKHRRIKENDQRELGQSLTRASEWTDKTATQYKVEKGNDHTAMQRTIDEISTEVDGLDADIRQAKLDLPPTFTQFGKKVGYAFSSIGGGILGSLLGPVGTVLGAGAGAFAGKLFYAGAKEDEELIASDHGTVIKTGLAAGAALAGGITSYYLPSYVSAASILAGAASAAYAGKNALNAIYSHFYRKAYPRVIKVSKDAYNFILPQPDSRTSVIAQAAITRTMKAMGEAAEAQ